MIVILIELQTMGFFIFCSQEGDCHQHVVQFKPVFHLQVLSLVAAVIGFTARINLYGLNRSPCLHNFCILKNSVKKPLFVAQLQLFLYSMENQV